MRFCAFLMMSIELLQQERSFEIVEPKHFTESACKIPAPSMKSGWMGVFFVFAKINDHFLRFGYAYYQVVVLTPTNQPVFELPLYTHTR